MRTSFLVFSSLLATSTMLGTSLGGTPLAQASSILPTPMAVRNIAALDEGAGEDLQRKTPNSWQNFTSTSGNFSVKVPSQPEESKSKDDDGSESYSFAFTQDSGFYYIRYTDNPIFENNFTRQQIQEVLATAPQAFAEGSGGRITGKRPVSLLEHQGIEFDFQIKGIPGTGRAYLVQGRLYMLVGAGDSASTKAFLNSFQLLKSNLK